MSGDGNEQTRNNLGMIERNANRLLELINQLLDFRKIEEDMFHFKFKRQNVVKIVEKVYKQYYQTAKFNKLEISLEAEKNDIECNVDSEAIYKIVSNLIANAIKYAKNQILITVKERSGNLEIKMEQNTAWEPKSFVPLLKNTTEPAKPSGIKKDTAWNT